MESDMINKKAACIYVRVSDQRQVDGYSLDSQEDICRKEAAKQGYEVVKVFREEGVSAKTLERPELTNLLSFVKNKENNIHAIFVYHSSRLSRDTLNFLTLKSFFTSKGISVISATEPIAGDSPEQKFLATIMSAVNQLDNEIKGRNVANSMRRRFLEGHITCKPPLGYLFEKKEGKSIAVKDPVWFPILQTIWKRAVTEQLSLADIKKELNKYKMHRFKIGSIDKIFHNKFYMGILYSKKYGEATGRHEPMIDKGTYYTLQAQFQSRRFFKKTRTVLREDFMLRFIIRCPNCNNRLTSAWSKGQLKRYGYYFCLNCDKRKNFPKGKVEDKFLELLRTVKPTEKATTYYLEILKESYENKITTLNAQADWVFEEGMKTKKMLKTLEEKHLTGVYSDEDYLRIKDELNIKLHEKRTIHADTSIEMGEFETRLNLLKFYLNNIDFCFMKADPETRLKIGCSIFEKGVVFDGEVYRTPEIASHYRIAKDILTQGINSGEPELAYLEHISTWIKFSQSIYPGIKHLFLQ
jgi:site-specific DNA recombinase